MQNIEALEKRLWEAADQLRANSGLGSNEYFMPVLGILFLRQAYNRFSLAAKEVDKSLPVRGGVRRRVTKEDFTKRRSIYLQKEAQYEYLTGLPGDANIGRALNHGMELIEHDYESLRGILPRNYEAFSNDLLRSLIRIFNDEILRRASGDVFGRIYEYFLMKFAMQGAHDNGEFFTPPSIVQTIVNVIEPDHGIVFDPANGSGGMFVQTSHFLETREKEVQKMVTFYGQEKNETTIRIAKMNLTVHGLEGNIKRGNTFYEDEHEMLAKADFLMANPPFNVDGVDAEKIKNDPRLPFGLPGVNNKGAVTSGNYLWISYFYSYLNPEGRAGFVMSSQASSAGHGEMTVRKKVVQTGHVDVMISIRSNFFYTRSVPCELWFFDKGKPKAMQDKVLMIDARNIHRKVTRKIYDFSPEQLGNVAAIVWLYRGQTEKYLKLVRDYFDAMVSECTQIPDGLKAFHEGLQKLRAHFETFSKTLEKNKKVAAEKKQQFKEPVKEIDETVTLYEKDRRKVLGEIEAFLKSCEKTPPGTNGKQVKAREAFDSTADRLKGLMKQIELLAKLAVRVADQVKNLTAETQLLNSGLDRKEVAKLSKQFVIPKADSDETTLLRKALDNLKQVVYFHKQIHWLQAKFPDAKLRDVEGLVKLVARKIIEKNDWSLTPGRYVGVAPPEEDDDFDFEETLRDIHTELVDLNKEAAELAAKIQENFEELGS
ncbi:MAG: N-6 DNA methylase [Candidatus Eisenbacteria bacterium]|nr:N-6 DNA methylase [Candidatus Eisenbacteria bacterium]